MTMHLPMPAIPALTRTLGLAGTTAQRIVDFLHAWKSRRDLQFLAGFDDRMLRDIGLTRGDVRDAVAEPLWRDPTNVLVIRARERRGWRKRTAANDAPLHSTEPPHAPAPPLAPRLDDWSSRQFPARSRYY